MSRKMTYLIKLWRKKKEKKCDNKKEGFLDSWIAFFGRIPEH